MNWEEIRIEYETTNITLKALAEKYGVKDSTLRSRKNREKWQRNATGNNATQRKSVATEKRDKSPPKKEVQEPNVGSDELTDKQRLFCIYYTKYFNATKAYRKAYECAYTTAMSEGYRHLRNPKISKEIDRLRNEKLSEKKVGAGDILQKYIDIAFADIGDYVERSEEGYAVTVRPLEEMDTSIISELSNTENGIKLKLADKMKALEFLAKYTDLLSENDKKRLQNEKLKAETEKARAEAERISKENTDDELDEIIIVDEWSDEDEK